WLHIRSVIGYVRSLLSARFRTFDSHALPAVLGCDVGVDARKSTSPGCGRKSTLAGRMITCCIQQHTRKKRICGFAPRGTPDPLSVLFRFCDCSSQFSFE